MVKGRNLIELTHYKRKRWPWMKGGGGGGGGGAGEKQQREALRKSESPREGDPRKEKTKWRTTHNKRVVRN